MFSYLSPRKAFILVEDLGGEIFEAYSCGNGRFIPGTPSADIEVYFRVDRNESSLSLQIYDFNLLQWLCATHNNFNDVLSGASISMHSLLPCYPEISAKFDQGKREGRNFDALELFVHHFLREGSIFACFGFERLYEEQILTELHYHDMHNQHRSISDDLDLLDEAIEELGKDNIQESSQTFSFIQEPSLVQLQAAIKQRDLNLVLNVLAKDQGSVDAKTLHLAMRYYERAIFLLLLERGAQVDGDNFTAGPLYHAAKAGHTEAVQLLLSHGANIEGRCSYVNATPMNGAASGGHLEIIQYLVEENGANIDGNGYKSPLSCAIKHRHAHIVDYLLRAGATVVQHNYLELLSQFMVDKEIIYGDFLERSIAGMGNDARESLRYRAYTEGHFEIVRYLKESGANGSSSAANLEQNSWPQETSEVTGQFQTVSPLLEATCGYPNRRYEGSKPVDRPIEINKSLEESSKPIGGPMENDELLEEPSKSIGSRSRAWGKWLVCDSARWKEYSTWLCPRTVQDSICTTPTFSRNDTYTVGWIRPLAVEFTAYRSMLNSEHESPKEVENCPAVAAIQAQKRKTMTRQLMAKTANSCEKLLDAGTKESASAGLRAFLSHIGNSFSVWKSGTRAIRDICDGYMPTCSISSIVSALQVAGAMRSVVPPSQLRCSKAEFVDDIPRWAALLSPVDHHLFFEIASHLWGVPASTTALEGADTLWRPLESLQLLVDSLVRGSGLFYPVCGKTFGSYRLQTLRQQYHPTSRHTHTGERKPPLTNWCPSQAQGAQGDMHTNSFKPPDPEVEQSNILARITVFMAGAIFGAIMLYLCLFRCGFLTLRLPILTSDDGQGWPLDQIITRNSVIIAIYLGTTSPIDLRSYKNIESLLPVSPSMEGAQGYTSAVQSFYGSHRIIGDSPVSDDTIMEPTPADCSPSGSSNLATSSSTTTISPFPSSTVPDIANNTSAPVDGAVYCKYCSSRFILGKNGRRGQASNLQRHINRYHRDNEKYRCGSCGKVSSNKWNIKIHEEKHCRVKKRKQQPRCQGKQKHVLTRIS